MKVEFQLQKKVFEIPTEPLRKIPIPVYRQLKDNSKPVYLDNDYIEYHEPTEDELDKRIEYDMDEQDKCWLDLLNNERKLENLKDVSQDFFEWVMDRLEKEWFELKDSGNLQDDEEPVVDGECAICGDGECENLNAIVFCDGCNLAVHQDCYGIPFIPEGQWLCRKCMLSPSDPVSCIFCPNDRGAFKQTVNNKWAHSVCALWIPEVTVANPVYMEPIDTIEKIPKSRWKLTCYICKIRMGCCIQCDAKNCFTPFHVTCAKVAGLYMKIKVLNHDQVSMRAYCDRHTPQEHQEKFHVSAGVSIVQKEYERLRRLQDKLSAEKASSKKYVKKSEKNTLDSGNETDTSMLSTQNDPSKEYLVHLNHIVPHYIYQRVVDRCQMKNLPQRNVAIVKICKYWTLKREKSRGAPLLKRLHLEPWTANATALKEKEEKRLKRHQEVVKLKENLLEMKAIVEQIRKREKKKLLLYSIIKEYVDVTLKPLTVVLSNALEELRQMDKEKFFWSPVTEELAPDYFEIIKVPMDFTSIERKIENLEYSSLDSFEKDVFLICNNAKTYNHPKTVYFKSAQRLEEQASNLFTAIRSKDYLYRSIDLKTMTLPFKLSPMMFSYGVPEGYEEPPEIRDVNFEQFFFGSSGHNTPSTSPKMKQIKEKRESVDQSNVKKKLKSTPVIPRNKVGDQKKRIEPIRKKSRQQRK